MWNLKIVLRVQVSMFQRSLLPLVFLLATWVGVSPAEAEIEIRGLVVDAEAKPTAGAVVRLFERQGRFAEDLQRLAANPRSPAAITRSDRQGRFLLSAPKAGLYEVTITARGRRPVRALLSPTIESRELPAAVLETSFPVRVRVTDRDGPIYGATVVLLEVTPQTLDKPFWETAPRFRTTDDNGIARLPRGEAETSRLAVLAAGYPEGRTESFSLLSQVEVEVEKGIPRTFQVLDESDQPQAGALVRLGPDFIPMGITDEQGFFTVAVPAEGNVVVSAETENALAGWNVIELEPVEGQSLVLEPPWTIDGRVVDAVNRRNLQGAWVALDDRLTRSDNAGRFFIDVPRRPRNYRELQKNPGFSWGALRVASSGYIPSAVPVVKRGAEPRLQDSTVELVPAFQLRGQVLDEEEQPVAGVTISPRRRFGRSGEIARSNAAGRFSLAARPGTQEIEAHKTGYARLTQTLVPTSETPLVLRLWRARRAVGTVADASGRPIRDARVSLWPTEKGPNGEMLGQAAHSAATDDDGSFVIPEVSLGTFSLRAVADGFAPFTAPGIEIRFTPGSEADFELGTVFLDEGGLISGRVVDRNGYGVGEARVDFEAWSSRGRLAPWELAEDSWVVTDDDGYFEVADCIPGDKLEMWAWKLNYAQGAARGVECPAQEVELILDATTAVRGTVLDPGGAPVAAAAISADYQGVSGDRWSRFAKTDAQGNFELSPLEAGRMEVKVQADGFLPASQWIDVQPGKAFEGLTFRLREGSILEGFVLDPDGQPIYRAFVRCAQNGASCGYEMTDELGRFRLGSLAPGPAEIRVFLSNVLRAEEQVHLEEGINHLQVDISPGYAVQGRVVQGDGSPVAGATIRAAGDRASSQADGRFQLTSVPNGTHRLYVQKGNAVSAEYDVVVDGMPVEGLKIVLKGSSRITGRVLGLEPAALAQVRVMAWRGRQGWRMAELDFDGRYVIEAVEPGNWTVEAREPSSDRRTRSRVEIVPGVPETLLDLEFFPGAPFNAQILVDNTPEAGAHVELWPLDSSQALPGLDGIVRHRSRTDYNGTVRVDGLEDGRYLLQIRGQGDVLHRQEVRVPVEDLVIRLSTASFSGRVVDETGQGIESVSLVLEPAAVSLARPANPSTSTDSSGAFAFQRLVTGSYTLWVTKPGWEVAENPVELGAGANAFQVVLSRSSNP